MNSRQNSMKRHCQTRKKIQIQGEYHDLYVQINTLLLADVFESLSNKCKEIRARSFTLFFDTWISMVGMPDENKSWTRITGGC